jgi:putative tributyrin esterase
MQIRTETWRSEVLGREKSITVALPPSYSAVGRPFPVVYLLHGHGGNRHTWLRSVDLAEELAGSHVIAVFPECGRFWFINDAGGRCYESYLVDEVVTHIDQHFNTVASRTGRAMAGFSMGGASAVFQALRHPDLFAVAGSHSGAFEAPLREGDPYRRYRSSGQLAMPTVREHERVWGPVRSQVRQTYHPYRLLDDRDRSYPLKVYTDVGTDDHRRVISMNRNMRDALSVSGVDHEYRERAGGHDWAFVRSGVPALFGFIRDAIDRS